MALLTPQSISRHPSWVGRRAAALALLAVVTAGCAQGGEVTFVNRAVAPSAADVAAQQASAPATEGGLLPAGATGPAGATTPADVRSGARPAAAANAPAAGGVIRLGTVLPLQGGQRDFGEPILRTTQAYIDEVNARGGVNGWRYELIAYNACLICQGDAFAAVRRLVEQDHVFALVNTYVMVDAFESVIPYLQQKGVPLIQGASESQTSDALSPINFATAPTGAFYGRFIPVMAKRYAGITKVGITYLNVPAESGGIDILARELEKEGVQVVDREPIPAAEDAVTNMDSVVTRMRSRGADGVVATNPVLVIYGRLAASRQGWQVPWVGPAAWSRLVEDSCGATCDDLVLTDTAGLSYPDRPTPQMRQFIDTMARRYPGADTTGHTLAAWVGMQLLSEAVARTGPDRPAFLRTVESFHNLDLGTTSPLTFGPDRHLGGSASILLRLKGGKYVRASDPLNFGEADVS
jgi:branched-chain amino acid transport system substrate-binding protein